MSGYTSLVETSGLLEKNTHKLSNCHYGLKDVKEKAKLCTIGQRLAKELCISGTIPELDVAVLKKARQMHKTIFFNY